MPFSRIFGFGGKILYENTPAVTTSTLSGAISKNLKKRDMTFVGSTILYADLQAIGVINAHRDGCWLHGGNSLSLQQRRFRNAEAPALIHITFQIRAVKANDIQAVSSSPPAPGTRCVTKMQLFFEPH